jgi:hypothetical protein
MIPMQPKTGSTESKTAQSTTVDTTKVITNTCTDLNGGKLVESKVYCKPFGKLVLKLLRSSSHMTNPLMNTNGMEKVHHWTKDTSTPALLNNRTASTFCGEAMGDDMPPKLQLKAMPSKTVFGHVDCSGSSRKTGRTTADSKTAAATLDRNIDKTTPSAIIERRIRLGRWPARCKRRRANRDEM